MQQMFERADAGERAVLVHCDVGRNVDHEAHAEFRELARASGVAVVGELKARLDRPHPAHFVGSGKAEEIAELVASREANVVLFGCALTPVQERNLERRLSSRVLDRTTLILDIFAQRARSHEGQLEVELAQLRHLSTRLVRGWTHLERQRGGGVGLRGPGETQLETDRRLLSARVKQLKSRLEKVGKQRDEGRRARQRREVPQVALVGYTNAGKSTLFNRLTGANAFAEDLLFATLDPTVRRLQPAFGQAPIVLADTVGFIRDLPPELVAAFRSTLAEARDADLLLHVIDHTDPERDRHIAEVEKIVDAIGLGEIPRVRAYNKIDRSGALPGRRDADGPPVIVYVSAREELGLEELVVVIRQRLGLEPEPFELEINADSPDLRAEFWRRGWVKAEQPHVDGGWVLSLCAVRAEIELLCAGVGREAVLTQL